MHLVILAPVMLAHLVILAPNVPLVNALGYISTLKKFSKELSVIFKVHYKKCQGLANESWLFLVKKLSKSVRVSLIYYRTLLGLWSYSHNDVVSDLILAPNGDQDLVFCKLKKCLESIIIFLLLCVCLFLELQVLL